MVNLRERGVLLPVHRGVFRVAVVADTFEARCAAACAADPSAIITGVAAARLWRFRHVWRPDRPHMLVRHGRTPLVRGVELRRTNNVLAEDRVDRDDGIAVASPPRTWFDCAKDVDDERFERLTEWVLDHHAGLPTLWRTARRLCAHGRDGSRRVREVMERRVDWQKPDAQRDKQRDRRARLVGWQIERVSDQDVADDFRGTIDQLERLHDQRRLATTA